MRCDPRSEISHLKECCTQERLCECVNHFIPTGVSRENVSLLDGMSVNGLPQLSGITNICGSQLDLLFANAANAMPFWSTAPPS